MSAVDLDHDFPVGYCARCARDVLTHVHLDADGDDQRLCLHCDATMDPEELRWIGEAELLAIGYAPVPQGGCGRPDCGQGRCSR
jgi:hypothetical protein